MIFNRLEDFKIHIALIDDSGNRLSYDELIRAADDFADHIGNRSIILLKIRNDLGSVVAYVGALRNGIVPILVGDDINETSLSEIIRKYKPSYIWESSENEHNSDRIVYRFGNYVLMERGEAGYKIYPELALLLTTSGSTGSPKLVRQSYQNIISNTESIITYLGIGASDRPILTLPLYYTYGLSILNTHLSVGATVLLTEEGIISRKFWSFFKEEKATTFGGVPYTYEMLKRLRFERMELPSLRYITQAGGKLPKELAKDFLETCREKKIRMIIMYGQTEATARMSYLPWEKAVEKPGSIGIAIPGGRFALEGEEGQIITRTEEPGELIYYGENVTLGYAENYSDLIKGDENRGVLHTGDIAQRDEDGYYYIIGRKKRFLKLFGKRVNLDEVEILLRREGYDAACSGTDDNMHIYITDNAKTEDVRKYVVNHTTISNSGFDVRYIECIPRNSSGKILYSELAD